MAKVYITVDLVVELDESYIPALVSKPDETLEEYKECKALVLDILHETEKSTAIIAKSEIADILVELA